MVFSGFLLSTVTDSLYEIRLQGIMVVIFIKTNIQSKIVNTTTMNLTIRHACRESGNCVYQSKYPVQDDSLQAHLI